MDLSTYFFGFLAVSVFLLMIAITIYNNLVNSKHAVSQAWSNIDILLKQRHDELPKLVETCKQYMQFEQATLNMVMQARARIASAREATDVSSLGAAEGMLRMGLGNLYAVAEAYPELKASEKFQYLQTRISSLENGIADRREFYNESVKNNNVLIDQFPEIIIARWFGFGARDLLEFSIEDKADPNLGKLFA
ncbi:MAG: LemA family protein [Nitrosomonas sp.]|jgi:LemA protein|nr:LemA family protein [Nitrosomonas sp.]MCC7135391.1 LemA family protein [Nitrosomonas sp.]